MKMTEIHEDSHSKISQLQDKRIEGTMALVEIANTDEIILYVGKTFSLIKQAEEYY